MKTIALNEFKSLQENNLHSIAKIEWWLLKYDEYYKDLKSYWVCPNEGCLMKIDFYCLCENKHDEYIFLELFKELDEFSQFHRNEPYFKQELETYNKVKDNQVKLKNLIIRNEQIGADT